MKINELITEQQLDELQFCTTGPGGYKCTPCKDDCSGHTAGYQYTKHNRYTQPSFSNSEPGNTDASFYKGSVYGAYQNDKQINPNAPHYRYDKRDKTATNKAGKFTKYYGPSRIQGYSNKNIKYGTTAPTTNTTTPPQP
jgi:hypothetical protein